VRPTAIDQFKKRKATKRMTWQEHLKRCAAKYQAQKKAQAAAIKKPARRITGKSTLQAPTRRKNYKFRPGEDVD